MIARINEECNLENCAQQARANQLQQQENEMETGNSWLLKVSISSFFFSLLILHFNQYKFYSQESFHYSQLEKLLDIDSEFVALLKLEVINQLFDHWLVYSSASIHRSVLTTTGTQSRSTGWCYTGIHQNFCMKYQHQTLSLIGSVTGTTSICLTSSCSPSWRTGDHIDQSEAPSFYIDQSQRPRHGHRPHLSPLHADPHRPGQKQQTQQGGLDILQPDLPLLWNLQVPSYNIEKEIVQ